MTDRFKGAWVAFDRDIREDDVEPIQIALAMIKGVASVKLSMAQGEDITTQMRLDREWKERIYKMLTNLD